MNQAVELVNTQNFRLVSIYEFTKQHESMLKTKEENKIKAEKAIKNQTATFDDLVIIEPYLQWLMDEAIHYKKQSKRKRHVCANQRWYGYAEFEGIGLKNKLVKLVGWSARNILLKNNYCYDLAYHAIYDALPYCRNCGCF